MNYREEEGQTIKGSQDSCNNKQNLSIRSRHLNKLSIPRQNRVFQPSSWLTGGYWDQWWGGRGEGLNWIECDGLALRKLFEPSFSFHNTRGGTKVRRRNRCKHERRCSCCLRGFWWLLSITMIRNLRWESSRDEDLARAKEEESLFSSKNHDNFKNMKSVF